MNCLLNMFSKKKEPIKAAHQLETAQVIKNDVALKAEKITIGKYDDTEIRNLIADLNEKIIELQNKEDKDTVYDDSEIQRRLLSLGEKIWQLKEREDKDTIYDDTEIRVMLESLQDNLDRLNAQEDKDTVYDDTEIRNMISKLQNSLQTGWDGTILSGMLDLTELFRKGDADIINQAIKDNSSKAIYVGPGDYNVTGTIMLLCKQFYCLGNIIGPANVVNLKPMSEYYPGTLYKNDVIRTVVCLSGSNANIYINKITVKHNYCGFYVYYSKASNINIGSIVGDYPYKYNDIRSEYKSVFNSGAQFKSKVTRYKPISSNWHMNAGFMTDHIADSTINIDCIENLNFGLNFIETIPDKNSDAVKFTGINFNYIEIMCNRWNFNTIACKKAINFDFANAIEWDEGCLNTSYVTKHSESGNNIHGNVFTISGFDGTGAAKRTNAIETMNSYYYDPEADNRRIMFNIIGKKNDTLSNNTFNVSYFQGVYDVVVNAKNVSNITWNGYLQPNDVYFNDGTSHSQRNKIASTYYKGTTKGYEEVQNITVDPILIFDNCYNMKFNNTQRAFLRPNEIKVIGDCKNIFINQVDSTDNGDFYHQVTKTNVANIKKRIYDGSNIYAQGYLDGYTQI